MSDTGSSERSQPGTPATETARHGVEQAESGERAGVKQVEQARTADPSGTEAVEQEASEGPQGRGLSR